MIQHPDVQVKAQAELDEFIGSDRFVTLDDKVNLNYVHAVVFGRSFGPAGTVQFCRQFVESVQTWPRSWQTRCWETLGKGTVAPAPWVCTIAVRY
uniref:DUF4440 domain-containing protein n=1 Tax=Panagrellus redivivus TaxID=6233 RepID=A0A7E4V2Z9_PANRE